MNKFAFVKSLNIFNKNINYKFLQVEAIVTQENIPLLYL